MKKEYTLTNIIQCEDDSRLSDSMHISVNKSLIQVATTHTTQNGDKKDCKVKLIKIPIEWRNIDTMKAF